MTKTKKGAGVSVLDRNGRVLDYTCDSLSRQTTEKWYNNLTDAEAKQSIQKMYTTMYDDAGRVASIGDYDYTYSIFGNLTSTTQDLTGLTDDVEFSYAYDVLGRKTSVSAKVGSTDDYVNGYSYDNLGRITQITQDGVTGGNSVAEKRVDFGYSDDGTRATIPRFADLAGTKIVEYAYDSGQRWVRKTLDTNADGTIEESRVFVHDNGQIVLDFQKTGTAAASNSDLANRYLWGTNVDELLTDELVDDGTEDDNRWALTDHLNSVRDLVVYNPVTGTVSVVKHVAYDAFGNVTSDSATAVKSLFLYTARPFDVDSDLQNNLNRWYDLATGRWMSVDPIEAQSGAANFYRYCSNIPTAFTDPFGLKPIGYNWAIEDFFWWYYFGNGQDVPLKKIGMFDSWFDSIEEQLLVGLKIRLPNNLDLSGLSCEDQDPGTISAKVPIKKFTVPVNTGGGIWNLNTIMTNSQVVIQGSCQIDVECVRCCDGDILKDSESVSCDINFSVADKFENPLDKGGAFKKYNWPFAKMYRLTAQWDDRVEWFEWYNPCPENNPSEYSECSENQ